MSVPPVFLKLHGIFLKNNPDTMHFSSIRKMLSSPFLQFKTVLPCYTLEGGKFMSVFTHVTFQIQLEYEEEAGSFISTLKNNIVDAEGL